MGESARKEPSKKRRAEDDAGGHLTHDSRLANALEDPAQGASCEQNGSDGEYELFCVHVPKAWLTFFMTLRVPHSFAFCAKGWERVRRPRITGVPRRFRFANARYQSGDEGSDFGRSERRFRTHPISQKARNRMGHPPMRKSFTAIADNTTSGREGLLPDLSPGSRTSGPTRLRSRRRLSHPPGLRSGQSSSRHSRSGL